MSVLFEAPAPSQLHRYLTAALLRFRRFVNRSVAYQLESCERQAMRFMLKKLRDREPKDIGPRHTRIGIRSAVFGLILAGSLSPAVAKAERPDRGCVTAVVGDQSLR
ncbi:MAG: hypothetical protein U1E61_23190 [Bradyrhizobium sp.]